MTSGGFSLRDDFFVLLWPAFFLPCVLFCFLLFEAGWFDGTSDSADCSSRLLRLNSFFKKLISFVVSHSNEKATELNISAR